MGLLDTLALLGPSDMDFFPTKRVPYTENGRFMEPPCFLEEAENYTAFTAANS